MTLPPIRADVWVHQPTPQPSTGRAPVSEVGVRALSALRGLLSLSLDVRDLCKTASQEAGPLATRSRELLYCDRQQRQLEVIVSLLERVPVMVGGAVALAEVMGADVETDANVRPGRLEDAA